MGAAAHGVHSPDEHTHTHTHLHVRLRHARVITAGNEEQNNRWRDVHLMQCSGERGGWEGRRGIAGGVFEERERSECEEAWRGMPPHARPRLPSLFLPFFCPSQAG